MEKKLIVISVCLLAFAWSLWFFSTHPDTESKLDLGLIHQRKVYTFDTQVYLKDELLEACDEKDETRICKFACAPEGLCIFIPRNIVKDYNF